MSNEIIINRLFSGEYLEDESNIGHEIINIYKPTSKNNQYYIYLVPYGDYSHEHAKNNIDAVLLVRGHNANCLEVIAKATVIKRILDTNNFANKENSVYGWVGLKKGKDKNGDTEYIQLGKNINLSKKQKDKRENLLAEHEWQKQYIDDNNICYGGKKLYELFANNTSAKYPLSIFITFMAEKIVKVKEPFFIVNEKFFDDNNIKADNYKKDNHYEINNQKYYLISRGRLSGSAGSTFFSDKNTVLKQKKNESNEDFNNRKKEKRIRRRN